MRGRRFRSLLGVIWLLLAGVVPALLGGLPFDRELRAVPLDLLDAAGPGRVDQSLVVRTAAVILWLCWLVGLLSTIVAVTTKGDSSGCRGRLVVVGMLVLGLSPATAVGAESSTINSPEEIVSNQSESSDHRSLAPGTVVSSLVAGGLGWMASRWWMERRRGRTTEGTDEFRDSLLSSIRRYDIEIVASAADAVSNLEGSSPVFLRAHDGRIRATTNEASTAHLPWKRIGARVVEIDENEVAIPEERSDRLIVHVGNTEAGEIWCDLQRSGSLSVDPSRPESDDIVRALATSLAMSPVAPNVAVLVDDEPAGPRSSSDFDVSTTRRLAEVGPVVRVGSTVDECGTASVVLSPPTEDEVGLRWSGERWELAPLGVPITPVSLRRSDAGQLEKNIEALTEREWRSTSSEIDRLVNDRSRFLVSVLGPPEVIDPRGRRVRFERSKSRELVVWLALHPSIQKRSLARDAMWPVAIKDATFSNITADVRRSMTLASPPPPDEQWLGITLSDELPLHESVECDVDVVRQAVQATRAEPEVHGPRLLREALELVRGMPFAGTSYGWSDAISLETDAALLVVRAATMLADMCEQECDYDGAYWASARGLLAVPSHEDLVLLRMRLHWKRGDAKALQREWESYRRSLILDDGHVLEASLKIREFVRATKPIRIDGEDGSLDSGFRSEVG